MLELAPDRRPALRAAMGPEGDLVDLREQRCCLCFVAVEGPEILGYGWVSEQPEWIGEIRLELAPGEREAYLWNCVTLPARRRKGIFTTLLISIAGQLRARAIARLWIASAGGAEKALADAGFAPILELAEVRLLGLRRVTLNPAPGAGEGAVKAARGVLTLPARSLGLLPAARRH